MRTIRSTTGPTSDMLGDVLAWAIDGHPAFIQRYLRDISPENYEAVLTIIHSMGKEKVAEWVKCKLFYSLCYLTDMAVSNTGRREHSNPKQYAHIYTLDPKHWTNETLDLFSNHCFINNTPVNSYDFGGSDIMKYRSALRLFLSGKWSLKGYADWKNPDAY